MNFNPTPPEPTMPKKGHTCCVLGCIVNSKKTELADGRRPRFFCFPHEKKRPHLRRAWLALTRRTEASTNTRVCEFHFVDGKPSNINPHPILNMGMEATKMQKRAMELRQQRELRKLIMQQQMIATGQLLPEQQYQWTKEGGQPTGLPVMSQDQVGMLGMSQGQQQMQDLGQDQDALNVPHLDSPYADAVKLAAGMSLGDADDLPTQMANYGIPLPLVMHDRDQFDEGNESMISNGSLAQELQQPDEVEDNDESDDTPNSSDLIPPDFDQQSQPSADAIPDVCSKITPLNGNSASPSPVPPQPPSEATSSSNDLIPTPMSGTSDNGQPSTGVDIPPSTSADDVLGKPADNKSLVKEVNGFFDSIMTSTPQKENGHAPQVVNKSTFPMFRNQIAVQQSNKSPPLKVPSWQVKVNGTASVPSALEVPSAPLAKKPLKREVYATDEA
ncbi:uncharacterized protein [Amphiura filiformis]|uniref:uncharacterized protein n=1 Tax=Amphiura filiformis TaxID=82378 RepID=UPI003B2273F6